MLTDDLVMKCRLQPFESQLHPIDSYGMTVRQEVRRMFRTEQARCPRNVKQVALG